MISKISLANEKEYNELGQELNENFSKIFDLNNELSKNYSHIYIYQIDNKKIIQLPEIVEPPK